MAITQAATSQSAGNVAELDQLLGNDPVEETTGQEEEKAENSAVESEELETTQSEENAPTEEEEGEETPAEEEEESEQAEEEAEEEETDLLIEESERDYSNAAYEKAAAHYARTKKIELDPSDPAHRALLKELMDRGRDFNALKQEKAEADTRKQAAEEEAAKPGSEQQQQQVPSKPTAEQIQGFIQNAGKVAKAHLLPEVAKYVHQRFTKALWPDEDIPEVSQEQANDFTAALSEFFWMQLEDALPAILGQSRMSLSADPVFGTVETQAIQAQAFEQMDGMKDKSGKKLYPDIEEMIESGILQKTISENPEIGRMMAGNGRNPVANQLLRYQTAYKIARGESVNLQTVSAAVKTGEKKAETRARKIASGRVSSGKTKGEFGKGPSQAQQTVSEITGGGGSKFSAALAQYGHKVR